MMRALRYGVCGCLALVWLVTGCGRGREPEASSGTEAGPLSVYVVNYPLQYFAERIGGSSVAVTFPAPGDGDPAFWKPDAATLAAYQQAELVLLNGAGYAAWAKHTSLPSARTVDTNQGNAAHLLKVVASATHAHGAEGEHAHAGVAFTTWIDPALAGAQAQAIAAALSRARPDQKVAFEHRLAALQRDLAMLDEQLTQLVAETRERPVIFSHPVYQYLAKRYQLNGRSVHWEPDAAPDEDMWAELKVLRAEHPAAWMIWEGEPLPATVARLKEIGIDSAVFDPCGNVPEAGDYLTVMQANIRNLQPVYAPEL